MLTKRMGIKKKNIHDYLDTVAIVKNINLIIAKTDESEAK